MFTESYSCHLKKHNLLQLLDQISTCYASKLIRQAVAYGQAREFCHSLPFSGEPPFLPGPLDIPLLDAISSQL